MDDPNDFQIFLRAIKHYATHHKALSIIVVILLLFVIAGSIGSASNAKNNNNSTIGSNSAGTFSSSDSKSNSSNSSSNSTVASKPQQPSCTSYQAIDSQTWLEIVKDPGSYKDQCFTVYGDVTQFDAATGINAFLADVGGVQQTPTYGIVSYPSNTYLTGNASTLKNVVEQDLFTAQVMVLGSYSYKTQIGGNTTTPELQVNSITVTGNTSGSSESSASSSN